MQPVLIGASSVLAVIAVMPYILDILKGKTKPRIVSWLIWTILTGIGSAASFSDHQYASAILTLSSTVMELAVLVLGLLKAGDRTFEAFDIWCLGSAVVGLMLWWIFNSPGIAVLSSVLIDFVGAVPTLRHAWQKPYEETWLTFFISAACAALTLMAAGNTRITAIAYPVYLVTANILLTLTITLRYKYMRRGAPAELREL